jgi:hypothetical protein
MHFQIVAIVAGLLLNRCQRPSFTTGLKIHPSGNEVDFMTWNPLRTLPPRNWLDLWETGRIMQRAFAEQRHSMRAVYALLDEVLDTPPDTPEEFMVRMGEVPDIFYKRRRNLFSALFQATYQILDIAPERRLLYGKLNHLFRIWVTSADNLLDNEDKVVVPMAMAGRSRIMNQVVAVMAADRVLHHLLEEAVEEGILPADKSALLGDRALQILLPSAAQEASEEGGIVHRPDPEYVLSTIHVLKTGLLFHIPFVGPETLDTHLDRRRLRAVKDALLQFGIGCQLLDDLRDMARDFVERRHNYVLSILACEEHPILQVWKNRQISLDERLYREIPHAALPTLRRALDILCGALGTLASNGLSLGHDRNRDVACSMLNILDLEDLSHAC